MKCFFQRKYSSLRPSVTVDEQLSKLFIAHARRFVPAIHSSTTDLQQRLPCQIEVLKRIAVGGVFLNRCFWFLVAASSTDGSGDDAAGGHGPTASGASGGVLSSFRRFADGRPDVPEEDDLVGSAGHDLTAA